MSYKDLRAVEKYIEKKMLDNIQDDLVYEKLATIDTSIARKKGNTIGFDKWIPLKDTIFDNINKDLVQDGLEVFVNAKQDVYKEFILPEFSSGVSKGSLKLIQETGEILPIGDWLPYSEEMELLHDRFTVDNLSMQMSEVAGIVIDSFFRDAYYNQATIQLTSTNIADADFTNTIRKLQTTFELVGAKRIVGRTIGGSNTFGSVPVDLMYVAFGHTIAMEAVEKNPDFVPVEKYIDVIGKNNVFPNEVGKIKGVRFVGDANAYLEKTGANTYKTKFVVSARDHTANIKIAGEGRIQTIVKPLSQGGSDNALNRAGTVGWKSWIGAKVLYPERLAVITADFEY